MKLRYGALTLINECRLIERALQGVNNHRRSYRITNALLDRVRLEYRRKVEIPAVDEDKIARYTEKEVLDKWAEIVTRHEAPL